MSTRCVHQGDGWDVWARPGDATLEISLDIDQLCGDRYAHPDPDHRVLVIPAETVKWVAADSAEATILGVLENASSDQIIAIEALIHSLSTERRGK